VVKRDANGRFVKGHKGIGGRKPRTAEEDIKRALERAKPENEVLAKLAEAIGRRESWAISLYLGYKWGKPIERKEIDQRLFAQVEHDFTDSDIAETWNILDELGVLQPAAEEAGDAEAE
jgi:hypothetical protein